MRDQLLARFPLFAALPPGEVDALVASARPLRLTAGGTLFDEHQPCRGFPLLLAGSVRVVKASGQGREILLYRVEPGEGCILSAGCLLAGTRYGARGLAETDVYLLALAAAAFEELILGFTPFRQFVFAMYGQRLVDVMTLVEEVAFHRLDERLAQLLVRRGPVLRATHQSLADELGSVREIVSRLLRSFAERGYVKLERERVTVLDAQRLARASGQVESPVSR